MSITKIFKHDHLGEVRCWKDSNDNISFLASDVAKGLGYRDAYNMIRSLDDDEKDTQIVSTPGGNQTMTVITESGFYHAAMKSRMPCAKKFRKWVTSEVLPQIRKTGGYISPLTPEGGIASDAEIMARALMIAQKTIEQKDRLLEAQRPKVQFAEAVVSADGSILIRDLAKLLTQNGFTIGQNRLFNFLRKHGYIFKNDTRPMQRYVEMGLFDTTVTIVDTHHGSIERVTTKVTGKGQEYFLNGFKEGRFFL